MRYELAESHLVHALTGLINVELAVDVDEPCLDDNCLQDARMKRVAR